MPRTLSLLAALTFAAALTLAGCPGVVIVHVTGISLDQGTLDLSAGGLPGVLSATVAPEDATSKEVSWSTSDVTVATVSNAGLVTPLAVGAATITAKTTDSGYTATAVVTVSSAEVVGVYLDQATLTLPMGSTATLTATVVPSNAVNTTVVWESSNTAVATVAAGVVTPVAVGQAVVTVTTSDGGKRAACAVTVTAAHVAVTGVTLSPKVLSLNVSGSFLTITATIAPANATNKAIVWTSSNTSAATVSGAGVASAVAPGTTTITATTVDGSKTDTASVTVYAPPITSYSNIVTYAGTGLSGYTGDGSLAVNAQIGTPTGIVGDTTGAIYFADSGNHVIRKISAGGIITTIAGTGGLGYTGDGGLATAATFSGSIGGLALDGAGGLFIADTSNHAVRRIDHTSGFISTVAGTGVAGNDPSGTAIATAKLNSPTGVSVDGSGNIFIADQNNNLVKEVLASDSKVYYVAGLVGNQGDGADGSAAGTTAIGYVANLALDNSGNLLFSAWGFSGNYYPRVRKIDISTGGGGPGVVLNGILSTIAGGQVTGFSGDGGPATSAALATGHSLFFAPNSGLVYVADTSNHVVRKIDGLGTITTVAGTGTTPGYTGDNIAPTATRLNSPFAVYVDVNGVIYVSDSSNNRIRKVN